MRTIYKKHISTISLVKTHVWPNTPWHSRRISYHTVQSVISVDPCFTLGIAGAEQGPSSQCETLRSSQATIDFRVLTSAELAFAESMSR
eukprot:SAG25_NODE_380_length_8808_cov_3.861523_6_plen_89_part_00